MASVLKRHLRKHGASEVEKADLLGLGMMEFEEIQREVKDAVSRRNSKAYSQNDFRRKQFFDEASRVAPIFARSEFATSASIDRAIIGVRSTRGNAAKNAVQITSCAAHTDSHSNNLMTMAESCARESRWYPVGLPLYAATLEDR